MNITVTYQPNAKELTRASSLFVEKKPFLFYSITLMNIFVGLFLIVFLLKAVLLGLSTNEAIAGISCSLWLFGRKAFNQALLHWRMKNSPAVEKPITIEISHNGIAWFGKGLRTGNMAWDQVKYVMEAQNGFILPNAFTRFLWLPFRGFPTPEDITHFRQLISERKIIQRVFKNWQC